MTNTVNGGKQMEKMNTIGGSPDILEMSITGEIKRWGNANGIRIPKKILELVRLNENDQVDITVKDESILIKKKTKEYKSLSERITDFYNKPLDEIGLIDTVEEVDYGEPVGNEVW